MDERLEIEARKLVGRISAETAQEQEPKIRDALPQIISSGLSEGTAEFDVYTNAYEDERILRKDVLPAWGARKAKDIRRRDVILLLRLRVPGGVP